MVALTGTGTVRATTAICGPTMPRSGLTAMATVTVMRPVERTAMPVLTRPARQPKGGSLGCPDGDGDGWADAQDAFPDQRSQHIDTDGDGYGDNATLGAHKPDHWPNDASRNSSAEATMTCTPVPHRSGPRSERVVQFTCGISTSNEFAFAAVVSLEATSSITRESSEHFLTFTQSSGNSSP